MGAPKKPEVEPEAVEPEAAPEVEPEAVEPEADVEPVEVESVLPAEAEYTVVVFVAGTRNGEPWPPVGGVITLPASEAKDALLAGIVKAIED